jgi:threonine dehydrogenase-like Zn-dependent dehydrogenase
MMRAVRNTPDGIRVVDVPDVEASGERVAIRAASICGSDFNYIAAGTRFTLGHELSGMTADGRAIAIEGTTACRKCELCEQGRYNICPTRLSRALGFGWDGGMSDWLHVPAECAVWLPASVPVENASIVEPLSVSMHALRLAGIEPGQRVGVIGGGSIGLLAVGGLIDRGVDVGLFARHRHQLEAGERLGARAASGRYDVVVEAAGGIPALHDAIEACEPGGTLVVLGVYGGSIPLPLGAFTKELTVKASLGYCQYAGRREYEDSIALLARHPEIADAVITHRFPLDDAAEAFRTAADRKAGAIKVVLQP